MNYLITGGTGFIGKNLIENLLLNNKKVSVLTRNKAAALKIFANQVEIFDNWQEINPNYKIDHIINLAGEPIANKKWFKKQKEILLQSRILTTQNLIDLISKLKNKPKTLINASAIGFYGCSQIAEFDETSSAGLGFAADLCKKWEEEANKAKDLAVRVCFLRLGIVIGKNGGALAKMLPAFKMGLGGKIGDGKQVMSWVAMADVIAAINFLIANQKLTGAFNITAPDPVSNQVFSQTLAKTIHRPAFFNMPASFVKIIFGEMGEELLLKGQKVLPKKLLDAGYKFQYQKLADAIKQALN